MADWTAVERCRKPSGFGKRHLLAALGFLGFALSYAMRFSLSIAIVAMVNTDAVRKGQVQHSTAEAHNLPGSAHHRNPVVFKNDICPHDTTPHETMDLRLNLFHVDTIFGMINRSHEINPFEVFSTNISSKNFSLAATPLYEGYNYTVPGDGVQSETDTVEEQTGEFLWNEADQGVILGSFFWGYVLTQCLGGWISQKIGGKWPFGIGLLITALFAILTPAAARFGGMHWVIFVRIVQGLAGGVTVPSMQSILSMWFPPEERGKLGSFTLAGMPFGTSMSMLCSGFLIHYFGWPSVFYITGGLTLFWFLLWAFYAHATPADDKTISLDELKYIQAALGESRGKNDGRQQIKQKLQVPWLHVLLSPPFWAILVCNTCETWFLYTINAELPTYMKTVLHFDIKQNSVMSAFPHLLTLLVSVILTNIGDNLIERRYLSIGTVRKLSTSIAMWVSAAALLGVAYSGCDRVKTVTLLAVAIGANGGKFGGFLVNIIDIAPNYAGILMGTINTVSSMPGFFAPWVAGMIINDDPSLENWRLVFLITAAIGFVGNLIFILFASGEEQSWNGNQGGSSSNTDDNGLENDSSSSSLECINEVSLSNKMDKQIMNGADGVYIIPLNLLAHEERLPGLLPRAAPGVPHQQEDEGQQQQESFRCSA